MSISNEATSKEELTLYSVDEAAQILRLSRDYLYKLALRREIGSVKTGRRRCFREEHLKRFIESHTEEALY